MTTTRTKILMVIIRTKIIPGTRVDLTITNKISGTPIASHKISQNQWR